LDVAEGTVPEAEERRRLLAMSKQQDSLNQLRQAIAKFPRGKWYSPDTTAKKENWFVSVAQGQAVGMPTIGDRVWVSKSRGAYQLVELTEQKGEHVDTEGLARVFFAGKVVADL
jgi:hypothetical protein